MNSNYVDIDVVENLEAELMGHHRVLGVDIYKVYKPDLKKPEVINQKNIFEKWLNVQYDKPILSLKMF